MARNGNDIASRILVADDDPFIVGLVRETLEPEGFVVACASDGSEAVSMMAEGAFDLVILDVMMPGVDGFEACRLIRRDSEVPIVFLSARDEESDKVVGLTLGADDYIDKPFRPRELVARVRARLRRRTGGAGQDESLEAMGIEVSRRTHTASLLGENVNLTPKEFDMLAMLVANAGRPVSAQELFQGVWHEDYRSCDANTVMVHIRRLRQKLAEVDSSRCYIETVFGVGYKVPCEKRTS